MVSAVEDFDFMWLSESCHHLAKKHAKKADVKMWCWRRTCVCRVHDMNRDTILLLDMKIFESSFD
jgi:hypothetical protein